jgi:hypothetical protein
MDYMFGIILASMTMSLANLLRDSNRDLFHAFVLMMVGLAYVVLAYYSGTKTVLYREVLIALVFFVVAVFGYCKGLWYIVFGFVVHAAYTVYHPQLFPLERLPVWWQPFGYAYDITMAVWLSFIAARHGASRAELRDAPR